MIESAEPIYNLLQHFTNNIYIYNKYIIHIIRKFVMLTGFNSFETMYVWDDFHIQGS
jgi:hypothetical protein